MFATPAARAAESAPVTSHHTIATLVTDTDAWAPGVSFQAALRLRLAPGWHTYWKNPGAAGAAPTLALALPPGASAGAIGFPAPERLREGPLTAYAYTGDLLLPVTITPPLSGAALPLEASATWLVCADVCVPEEGKFRLDLPVGHPAPSPQAGLISLAMARLPGAADLVATIAPDGTLMATGPGLSARSVAGAAFFPDTPGALDDGAAQPFSVEPGRLTLALQPGPAFKAAAPMGGVLVLTAPSGQQRFLTITAAPGGAPAPPPLLRMLGFALLGGLILNLMPCVFPVLAMKAVALAGLGGAERRRVRREAGSYTGGVLIAFAGLGLVLLTLRAAGGAAGWGFQFQSPVFVAAMSWLLLAVGLGLSGVFEPGAVLGGGALAGAGQQLAAREGHAGSFFTGLLAVLVATPCTAPFMGAAIAGALAAPPAEALAVFLAMGLGLAAPTALFAAFPRLAGWLPRPGRWMLLLKQALAFPMYAAAAWLLWVLSAESGPDGVLAAAAGMVLVGFAAWALGAFGRLAGRGVAAVALLTALAVLPSVTAAPPQQTAPGAQAFSPDRLAALRQAGRPVFVDMSAAWCLTCLVNERIALTPRSVREAFAARDVAMLRGDWTRQDPAITEFLRAHGRDGVPLYVYYPAHGEATVLPQILTASMVLREVAGS